jgi:hypothetical protein
MEKRVAVFVSEAAVKFIAPIAGIQIRPREKY